MSPRLQAYADVTTFAEKACPFLLRDEACNNLQLGFIRHALEDPAFTFNFTATVESPTGQVVGVLTQTPGRSLVLSMLPPEALETVAQAVSEALPDLVGVNGPSDTVQSLAPLLAARLRASAVPHTHLGILTLRKVTAPSPAPGSFTIAQPEHLPIVLEWMSLFHEELTAMGAPPPASSTERQLHAAQVFLWLNQTSQPVSMAIQVRDLPNGGIIGYVYTPKARRGSGFAANCVANTSQIILDNGKEFCGLYVDLMNPISIRMYFKLGYGLIGESNEVRFTNDLPRPLLRHPTRYEWHVRVRS